jgi:hypothetical protein
VTARICSFQSAPDVKPSTRYEDLKAAVLKAGRFSSFEADANYTAGVLFSRLCRDPEVETFDLDYPWTGVRQKKETGR